MNIHKFIHIVKELKSEFQSGQCFHTTFALKGSKILAIGVNNYKKQHPRKKFGDYIKRGSKTYQASLHSEIDCIKKLGLRDDYHKITIVNIRVDNNGRLTNSEPCSNCKKVLSKYNFKRIYFTIDENSIGRYYNESM